MAPSKYGKYIVTELKTDYSAAYNAQYAQWANRVLFLDDKVVDGAFQMNVSWYLKPQPKEQVLAAHQHDAAEIIGFFGSDPADPYDLGGEVEFWLEDEQHILKRSCMIFVPGGLRHCPLILRRVDRPIFHYSTLGSSRYELQYSADRQPDAQS